MRTVSATISTAAAQASTDPIYLIRMGWDNGSPSPTYLRAATWDSDISWNAETWIASGIEITNLDSNGGSMNLPNGEADPWLALVMGEIPRERTIEIYKRYTNRTVSPHVADAVLVFSGYMDAAQIGSSIQVSLIEGTTKKAFPAGRIDPTVYTHLLPVGEKLYFGGDLVVVNG